MMIIIFRIHPLENVTSYSRTLQSNSDVNRCAFDCIHLLVKADCHIKSHTTSTSHAKIIILNKDITLKDGNNNG